MGKILYVVRHCHAEGKAPHAKLTEEGRQQAKALGRFFKTKDVDRIISSSLLRARETAWPLAESKQMHLEQDSRLSERVLADRDFEDWLVKLEDSFLDLHLKYEGGESSIEAMTRVKNIVDALKEDSRTMLITHGNLMTLLLRCFDERYGFQEWQSLTYPDVYLLSIEGEMAHIERLWEDDPHF